MSVGLDSLSLHMLNSFHNHIRFDLNPGFTEGILAGFQFLYSGSEIIQIQFASF